MPAAVAIWRPLAEKGDADAAFNLGQAYRLGRGVTTRPRARRRPGSIGPRARAMSTPRPRSACCCSRTATASAAMRWLKSAAERGEPRALLIYGTALFNGDGVERDPVTGLCLCQPRRRAGTRPGQGDARRNGQDPAARPAAEGRCGRDRQGGAIQTPRRPKRRPKRQAEPSRQETASTSPTAPARRRVPAHGGSSSAHSRKRSSAEALFDKLSRQAVAGKQPVYVPAGTVTRLQVGPYRQPRRSVRGVALRSRDSPASRSRRNSRLALYHSWRGTPCAQSKASRPWWSKLGVGDFHQRRLGAIGDAKPRLLDHRAVVGAVADRQAHPPSSIRAPRALRSAHRAWPSHRRSVAEPLRSAGRPANIEAIGRDPLETDHLGDRLGERGKAARSPASSHRAARAHRPDQRLGARIGPDPLVQAAADARFLRVPRAARRARAARRRSRSRPASRAR